MVKPFFKTFYHDFSRPKLLKAKIWLRQIFLTFKRFKKLTWFLDDFFSTGVYCLPGKDRVATSVVVRILIFKNSRILKNYWIFCLWIDRYFITLVKSFLYEAI